MNEKRIEKELLDSVIASWDAYKMYVDWYDSSLKITPDTEIRELNEALMELMSAYPDE